MHINYFIGGSLASAIHGTIRATMDADIIADISIQDVDLFIKDLQEEFFIDEVSIHDAIVARICFNLIHKKTMFKIDVFPWKSEPFESSQMERKVFFKLSSSDDDSAYFASAEDILLAKINWYRLGGEISDRQWSDIRGIIRVQEFTLDYEYLRYWANQLSLTCLLEKALQA